MIFERSMFSISDSCNFSTSLGRHEDMNNVHAYCSAHKFINNPTL